MHKAVLAWGVMGLCACSPSNGSGASDPSESSDPSEPSDPSESSAPSEPDPSEPDPSEPDPSEPDPSEPDPSEPDPSEPDPSEPDPSESDPSEPDPSDPPDPPATVVPERDVCTAGYSNTATNAGALADVALTETSGLAASYLNPQLLWAHNDSGDSARVFAVGTDGAALGQVTLAGVTAVDFEDIAVALCPGGVGSCVYVADTGDNLHARSEVQLYVFQEPPREMLSTTTPLAVTDIETFLLSYPGGPVDVEALAVDALGDTAYLFEKADLNTVRAFALPLTAQAPADVVTVNVVAEFTPPGLSFVSLGRAITGADLHVDGTRLAMRVYSGVFEYVLDAGVPSLGDATAEPITLGPLSEPQGEAIAYDEAGTGIFTVSEDKDQLPGRMLHHFACEAP